MTVGAGAGIAAASSGIGSLGVAAANGFAIAVFASALMATSGGHLNPAVTLSALVGRKIKPGNAVGYVVSQLAGAVAGGFLLRAMFADRTWRSAGLGAPALTVSVGRGVLIEAVFTFFLAFVIWGTAIDDRGPKLGAIAIGATVFIGVLAVGSMTGGAFNPARYLGPAIAAGNLKDWWVYVVGPGLGGATAGVLYPAVLMRRT